MLIETASSNQMRDMFKRQPSMLALNIAKFWHFFKAHQPYLLWDDAVFFDGVADGTVDDVLDAGQLVRVDRLMEHRHQQQQQRQAD